MYIYIYVYIVNRSVVQCNHIAWTKSQSKLRYEKLNKVRLTPIIISRFSNNFWLCSCPVSNCPYMCVFIYLTNCMCVCVYVYMWASYCHSLWPLTSIAVIVSDYRSLLSISDMDCYSQKVLLVAVPRDNYA